MYRDLVGVMPTSSVGVLLSIYLKKYTRTLYEQKT